MNGILHTQLIAGFSLGSRPKILGILQPLHKESACFVFSNNWPADNGHGGWGEGMNGNKYPEIHLLMK